MNLPTKTLERKMLADGYKYVIGVDEVGMACLAGPVYVCAVSLTKEFFEKSHKNLSRLRDSKQLLPHQREKFYDELRKERGIKYQLASCSPATIDKINIYQASRLAMRRAITKLRPSHKSIVLVDGNKKIRGVGLPQKAIVGGDRKIFAIACASIIAKVTRDRLMTRLAKRYPQYGLEKHKGYPTKLHKTMLAQHGICEIHRKSFAPVANLL
ncbi:MAG: ribonuclease HII [Candidatus Yanofskybacteria bacterium RIFCSPHIGHO2_01_FULL_44_17]|uniref:Ribonuclease HII n=1 Tax=Candidatus Yanofskybacteria bacterium RIFCSPHIGHO2_01_FULL_44_17 TaxID=1802668 RepID=A0A1F8EZS2_9BACT|nr:MAG: ribonuclease HII [Candidatus Yanofskybacteria bacterium RIFCSPHIGHO2_01_FULL_44_17]